MVKITALQKYSRVGHSVSGRERPQTLTARQVSFPYPVSVIFCFYRHIGAFLTGLGHVVVELYGSLYCG